MPTPGTTQPHERFLQTGFIDPVRNTDALAGEIAGLRKEIAELRKELQPVPSLIVTGQKALDAFERLTRGG